MMKFQDIIYILNILNRLLKNLNHLIPNSFMNTASSSYETEAFLLKVKHQVSLIVLNSLIYCVVISLLFTATQ